MERNFNYTLLGKVAGATIPKGTNRKVKAYVKKLHRRGISIEELSNAILQAFERNNIIGCFYIRDGKEIILKVGN